LFEAPSIRTPSRAFASAAVPAELVPM